MTSSAFRYPAITVGTKATTTALQFVAQSVEVTNATANTVYVAFSQVQPVSQLLSQFDMLIPPWSGMIAPCSTDNLSVYQVAHVAPGNLAAGTVLIRAEDSKRSSQIWDIPITGAQRPNTATVPGNVYYACQRIMLAGNQTYSFRAVNVSPEIITGISVWNFDPAQTIQAIVTGDGSNNNPGPTSGYSDPNAATIYLPPGFFDLDITLDALTGDLLVFNPGGTAVDLQLMVRGF